MKKHWVIFIAIICLVVSFFVVKLFSNTSEEVTKFVTDPEVGKWLNKSNLILSRDKYWIIDIPETKNALGSVYEKQVFTKDSMVYERFLHVTDFGFQNIPDSSIIIEDNFTFSKDYTFKRSQKIDIGAVDVFSANQETISEIKKKVILSELRSLDPRNLNFDTTNCDESKYYVSRLYLGSLSDLGLEEVKVHTKFLSSGIGSEFVNSNISSLHILKEGALAMMLQPVTKLQGCRTEVKLETEITEERVTPELLEKELVEDGYEKKAKR